MPKGYWVAKANILDDKKLLSYGKEAEVAIEKVAINTIDKVICLKFIVFPH